MPEIRDIGIGSAEIRDIAIPNWTFDPPVTNLPYSPVTIDVGVPIVDIPGCVEAHEANNKSSVVGDDDPNGLVTYCDGNMPSFQAPEFEPNRMIMTGPPKVDTRQPKDTPAPRVPATDKLPPAAPATVQCPSLKQSQEQPVGYIFDSGRKEITGYRLEGSQCIREVRDVPIMEQVVNGIPPAEVVITTGGIAVVAATSALLAKPFADILLKVIKPTIKKVVKKIAAIRGKTVPVLSVTERRDLQRERTEAIRKLKSVLKPKG